MQTSQEVKEQVSDYLDKYPHESDRAQAVLHFLDRFEGIDLYSRNNFVGHITASAYILNKQANAILLLRHKFLQRWLQPGGHVEASDPDLQMGALREAVEETGLELTSLASIGNQIFDIDSHPIPANEKRSEPAHIHHDIAFLFSYTGDSPVNVDVSESTAAKWISLPDLHSEPTYRKIAIKFQAACLRKTQLLFKSILSGGVPTPNTWQTAVCQAPVAVCKDDFNGWCCWISFTVNS